MTEPFVAREELKKTRKTSLKPPGAFEVGQETGIETERIRESVFAGC